MKFKLVILISAIVFCSTSLFAQTANPTRPSASDNAYISEFGSPELELGAAFDDKVFSLPALLKLTFFPKLEAGISTTGLVINNGNETNSGDPAVQLKYQALNIQALALAFVGKVQTVRSNEPIYSVYVTPSLQFIAAQVDATAGLSIINSNGETKNSFFYAIAVSPKLNLPVGLYGEIFGETFNGNTSLSADFGISYAVSSDFVLDAAIAFGLNDNAPDWLAQIGFTKTLFKMF